MNQVDTAQMLRGMFVSLLSTTPTDGPALPERLCTETGFG